MLIVLSLLTLHRLTDAAMTLLEPGAVKEILQLDEPKDEKEKLIVDARAVLLQLKGASADAEDIDAPADGASSSSLQLLDQPSAIAVYDEITPEIGTEAIRQFLQHGKYEKVREMHALLLDRGVPLEQAATALVMQSETQTQRYEEANKLFDQVMNDGCVPLPVLWSAKVFNQTRCGELAAAKATLAQLAKFNIKDTCMYNAVLRGLLDLANKDRTRLPVMQEYWVEMKMLNVKPDLESFVLIIKNAGFQGQAEKAFFYYDELKALGLYPTAELFEALFMACGGAPQWVKGYEDIAFEAMFAMEREEVLPTLGVYNAVLRAFSRVGDVVAAEYYFWELQRKGFQPDRQTYIYLLDAYSLAQNIGVSKYTQKHRFQRPLPDLSLQDYAMQELGASRMIKNMTKHISTTTEAVTGKRVQTVIDDLRDNDPELEEEERLELIREAAKLRVARNKAAKMKANRIAKGLTPGQEDEDEEAELEKLMEEDEREYTEDDLFDLFVDQSHTVSPKFLTKMSSDSVFADPFIGYDGLRGLQIRAKHSPEHIAKRLEASTHVQQKLSALQMLDSGDDNPYLATLRKDMDVAAEWDMIEFGRCPPAGHYYHNLSPRERRAMHTRRAEMIYEDYLNKGYRPDAKILTRLLAVRAEAVDVDGALQVKQTFKELDIPLTPHAAEVLVKMYIRAHDMPSALEVMKDLADRGLLATPPAYGLIIRTFTQSGRVVEALRVLEEAAGKGVVVHEKFMRYLRARCETLGIAHPDIPPNPDKWVGEFKQRRKERNNASRSRTKDMEKHMWRV